MFGAAAFDPELHSVLELASDAELTELSNILYGQRLILFYSSIYQSVAGPFLPLCLGFRKMKANTCVLRCMEILHGERWMFNKFKH